LFQIHTANFVGLKLKLVAISYGNVGQRMMFGQKGHEAGDFLSSFQYLASRVDQTELELIVLIAHKLWLQRGSFLEES